MNYVNDLRKYLKDEIDVINNLDLESINSVMNVFNKARVDGKQIYICGNGGSAATASHFASDFNKGVSANLEKKYKFECLSDNVPMMMAVANDISYDEIFREPLKNKMKAGDIFVGISGSGNSRNVINAMEYAKKQGGVTVAIVGYDGGKLKNMADYCIHININNMQIAEDLHMVVDHLMMYTFCHSE